MKNNHQTLNEEILRIKSLFTEERLYGNLVEAGPKGMDPSLDDEDTPEKKKETPKKSEPIIITDHDPTWDYKAENGVWYTKKKNGGKDWISLSGNKKAYDNLNTKYPDTLEKSKNNTNNTDTDNTDTDNTDTDNIDTDNTDTDNIDNNKDNTKKDINNKDGKKTTTDDNDGTKKDDGEFNWDDISGIDPITKDDKGNIRKKYKENRDNIKAEDKRRLQLCDDVVKTLSSAFLPTLRKRRISKEDWAGTLGEQSKVQQGLFEACLKMEKVVKKHSTGSFINGKNKLESIAGILSGDIDEETHLTSRYKLFRGNKEEEEETTDTKSNDDKKTTGTDDKGRQKWDVYSNSRVWGTLTKKGNKYALTSKFGNQIAVRGSNKLGDGIFDKFLKNKRNNFPKGLLNSLITANKNGNVETKKGGKVVIFNVN